MEGDGTRRGWVGELEEESFWYGGPPMSWVVCNEGMSGRGVGFTCWAVSYQYATGNV